MSSLRARVTIAAVAASALLFALAGAVVVAVYAGSEREEADRALAEQARAEASDFALMDPRPRRRVFDRCCFTEDVFTRVVDRRGRFVYLTVRNKQDFPPIPFGFSDVEWHGERYRTFSEPANFGRDNVIEAAMSTAATDARIARFRTAVIVAAVLGALLVGIPAWILSGVALAPVVRLRERAADLSESANLSVRLLQEGAPELRELAYSLNRMIDRLQESVSQNVRALMATRTFTADAGHELRTPLTSLRANLDVLAREDVPDEDRRRALDDAVAAHGGVTSLIDALQVLARGDAALGERTTRVDVAELADAVVVDARRRHPHKRFTLDAPQEAHVPGDADGLRMLLGNLVDNAALHGGDHVRVRVASGDRYVHLAVDDDGPGVPDAEKERVFERFARGSAARNGTGSGLGLAIAAQQARLHGGRLKLDDSPLGGARFEVVLSARGTS